MKKKITFVISLISLETLLSIGKLSTHGIHKFSKILAFP